MSAHRIGDRDLAVSLRPEPDTHTSGIGAGVGAALASPVGILLVVPGLVAVVGLFLTVLGQTALHESTAQLGRDRFAEQTDFVARSISSSLSQADPLLDRLRELVATWSPSDAPTAIAQSLRGLMSGRPGIAYTSVSYADGTFQGAYLEDHVIRFKEVRATSQGRVMTVYHFTSAGGLVLHEKQPTTYDPRSRDFYRLAVKTGRRVWTKPYPFFGSNQTGVTRAEPLLETRGGGALKAVLTADFDVNALSHSMAHTPIAGARTLLYTRDGSLLAYPEGAAAIARIQGRHDRPISHGDLSDPVITSFFQALQLRAPAPRTFAELPGSGDAALAMVAAVPGFPELGWSVAAIVPETAFFKARAMHERQSLIAAGLSLLLAVAVAVVFSRHLIRARRAAANARDLARQASNRAKDLGSYRLIERLGKGGMGEVWRAEHRLLVRQAAIKLIRPESLASRTPRTDLRERFRREAQTLATLRSRHTIELFDYGVTEEGTFFFVMELLDGMDLQSLVAHHGPQPAGRVIHLLLQACSSLAEAHAAGLVHRDVKPANLFVCRAADEVDVVKVLDFGLVQAVQDVDERLLPVLPAHLSQQPSDDDPANQRLTRTGQHMGTPAFMAPEQVRGEATDARADLYSLGCAAVWLLTGRLVFQGETSMAMMAAHLYADVPDLATLTTRHVPPALNDILRRCLAKAREDRPRDARELAEALRAIVLPGDEAWSPERARGWWAERITRVGPGAGEPSGVRSQQLAIRPN